MSDIYCTSHEKFLCPVKYRIIKISLYYVNTIANNNSTNSNNNVHKRKICLSNYFKQSHRVSRKRRLNYHKFQCFVKLRPTLDRSNLKRSIESRKNRTNTNIQIFVENCPIPIPSIFLPICRPLPVFVLQIFCLLRLRNACNRSSTMMHDTPFEIINGNARLFFYS